MNLIIAGKDRTSDIGQQIVNRAKQRVQNSPVPFLSPQHSALCLKDEITADGYLKQFVRLLKMRHGASTAPFPIPARAGLSGRIMAVLRRVLWKLLRYQHDRITFQQNLINELFITGIEIQQKTIQGKMDGISKRLETLESEVKRLR
ncbi:MAG: hypothetical protein PHR77_06395 [Kiritimatiellae bacterium]|nr:hypothetical protein [Kiritimatiellia bacterium]MDD5522664.1 hypothetical protein [Kiritimatiellia bacterium]